MKTIRLLCDVYFFQIHRIQDICLGSKSVKNKKVAYCRDTLPQKKIQVKNFKNKRDISNLVILLVLKILVALKKSFGMV